MKINQFATVHAVAQKVVQKTNLKYAEVRPNFSIMLGVVILLSFHRQGFTKETRTVQDLRFVKPLQGGRLTIAGKDSRKSLINDSEVLSNGDEQESRFTVQVEDI